MYCRCGNPRICNRNPFTDVCNSRTHTHMIYYISSSIKHMVMADTLITKAERTAAAAERIGMDDIAAAMRDDARLFKELKDGFRRFGEDI